VKNFAWDDATFDSIDWEATYSTIKSLTIPDHRFVTTLFFKLLPLGKILWQRIASNPVTCPSLGHPSKDEWHWITCPGWVDWHFTEGQTFPTY
jgi:hypothetical protein